MTDEELRQMLIRERTKRGWSQEAVAVQMGMGYQSSYGVYESPNGAPPTLKLLRKVAKAYDMDIVIEFRPKVDERVAVLEGK